MGCKSFGISQVLIGLHRVGITGLGEALEKAAESALTDRDAITKLILETLAAENFIPESRMDAYRTTLWREYLRFTKQDFSGFYSEVDVVVKGAPGAEMDKFLETATSVFADFELRPVVRVEPPDAAGPNPQLIVHGEAIVRGSADRKHFKDAVRKSLTDW